MNEYSSLNSDEMQEKIKLLKDLWYEFMQRTVPAYIEECKELGQEYQSVDSFDIKEMGHISNMALREVFERVHQREDYFERYHNGLKMSNYKEIGLIAYWLVKLKPFYLEEGYFDDFFCFRINEEFALYFIFNSVARYATEQGNKYSLKRVDTELYNELLYTMQYRDLSKEAYGCIVELISVATNID